MNLFDPFDDPIPSPALSKNSAVLGLNSTKPTSTTTQKTNIDDLFGSLDDSFTATPANTPITINNNTTMKPQPSPVHHSNQQDLFGIFATTPNNIPSSATLPNLNQFVSFIYDIN